MSEAEQRRAAQCSARFRANGCVWRDLSTRREAWPRSIGRPAPRTRLSRSEFVSTSDHLAARFQSSYRIDMLAMTLDRLQFISLINAENSNRPVGGFLETHDKNRLVSFLIGNL